MSAVSEYQATGLTGSSFNSCLFIEIRKRFRSLVTLSEAIIMIL